MTLSVAMFAVASVTPGKPALNSIMQIDKMKGERISRLTNHYLIAMSTLRLVYASLDVVLGMVLASLMLASQIRVVQDLQ